MATAFEVCTNTEKRGLALLVPLAKKRDWQVVMTDHQRWPQKFLGDMILHRGQRVKIVEVKVEERASGNFFVEVYSNRSRGTEGWFYTTAADVVWYLFLETGNLYEIPMKAFRDWCNERHGNGMRIDTYHMREQAKHEQANDTWGYCVPIHAVMNGVTGAKQLDLKDECPAEQRDLFGVFGS